MSIEIKDLKGEGTQVLLYLKDVVVTTTFRKVLLMNKFSSADTCCGICLQIKWEVNKLAFVLLIC